MRGFRRSPALPAGHRARKAACLAACGLPALLSPLPASAQSRSPADVPELGPYVHLIATASLGDSLRFNNPYRLSHQLGESGESLSRTPPYGNLGFGAAFGDPNGLQHGASLQWNRALSGLPQHVVTPAYLLVVDGFRPWLAFGRAGLPIVLNPDPNVGGELSFGGAYLLTAGLGLQAEIVGNIFYGAATWEKKITSIPMISLQAGIVVDFEVLP